MRIQKGIKYAEDKELCKVYGNNARKRVLEDFTIEQFKRNLVEIIHKM